MEAADVYGSIVVGAFADFLGAVGFFVAVFVASYRAFASSGAVEVCFEHPFSLCSGAHSMTCFDDVTAASAAKAAKLGPDWIP